MHLENASTINMLAEGIEWTVQLGWGIWTTSLIAMFCGDIVITIRVRIKNYLS